jgi:hypothetical protein
MTNSRIAHAARTDMFDAVVVPTMKQHFFEPDFEAARAVYAAVAAHDLTDGPPCWPMLVAPPGSAKTRILEPLEQLPNTHVIDRLTTNTLLSGQIRIGNGNGRPPSLLHRIGDSGIIVFADFSTVLGMRPDDRASVLAELRRVFDGHLRKEVGTSDIQPEWRGRITLVAATTPDIDRFYGAVFQSLGERFVMIRWHRPGQDTSGEQAAIMAMNQAASVTEDLAASVEFLFNGGSPLPDSVSVPDGVQERIAALSEFVVRARTHVARDAHKNLLYQPEAEAPTRLAQQLSQLARGSARLSRREEVGPNDMSLVRRVGLDSIPTLRRRVIDGCLQNRNLTADIPKSTLFNTREDLRLVKLLSNSTGDSWALSPLALRLLARADALVPKKYPSNELGEKR